jgi:hypothetical protein
MFGKASFFNENCDYSFGKSKSIFKFLNYKQYD